ncbi:SDR family oxidoreductase [Vibrio sp. SCSIO 43136]|uniref:SDR family NAD(P)-dependent oxidoreductase n=1 Tax=Vibrio sp. SCSIO 43136 TaxID=2819101 RepID=UPI002076393F|nr:SDR family oxidoreductase [Vibrio sp. SCSIO 43136]USD67187.1 SDR family oxidoreductase [Vibrio sp. SCSIO 43136]
MKTALVTGGSKGIGLGTVIRLQKLGYQVITCSRNQAHWQAVKERHSSLEEVLYFNLDITDEAALKSMFSAIKAEFGHLDIAVNNASPSIASRGEFSQVASEALQQTLQHDFWAQALCIQHQLQLMSKGAAIVNVSSVNGLRPTPNAAMYSAAKHAIEGLTRSLALENIAKGVRINSVAPGVTWTPRWEERQQESENIRQEVSDVVPIQRFAEIEEIVDAIEFLLSNKANYIVGHTLVVDGGLSLA